MYCLSVIVILTIEEKYCWNVKKYWAVGGTLNDVIEGGSESIEACNYIEGVPIGWSFLMLL